MSHMEVTMERPVLSIHFDGDIALNHRVSMRTLGKSLVHMQNSLDRAFLEKHNGVLWKYAKMKTEYFSEIDIYVAPPSSGGYIAEFFNESELVRLIVSRVSSAVKVAITESEKKGLENAENFVKTLGIRIAQLDKKLVDPTAYADLLQSPPEKVAKRYADRAIVREIDQILSILRSDACGSSTIEFSFKPDHKTTSFKFDSKKSFKFHAAVSKRELGTPVIYSAKVRSLNRKTLKGQIYNIDSKKESNILFASMADLLNVVSYFESDKVMKFYGIPIIEYGAFDPFAGDIYFAKIAH